MDSPSDFSDDALIEFGQGLSSKINRLVLQQLLIESRLLPRNTNRDELRRICPNSTKWDAVLRERLKTRETRPAALRALSLMVNHYLSDARIDPRVDTSIRKARQAADRGDLARVEREFQRLREYSEESTSPELRNPVILLYICAGSDRGRSAISQAITTIGAPSKIVAEGVSTSSRYPTSGGSIVLPSPPSNIEDSLANKETPTAAISSSSRQIEAMRPAAFSRPSWNIEPLVQARIPVSKVEWPEVDAVFAKLDSLAGLLNQYAQSIGGIPSSIEQVAKIRATLTPIDKALVDKIEEARSELDAVVSKAGAVVEAVLSSIQPELSDEVARIRQKLAKMDDLYPKQDVIDLLKQNEELLGQKFIEMSNTIKSIEELAGYLPTDPHEMLMVKCRHLALRFRTDELKKVLRDTETKTEEPRRLRLRVNNAIDIVLDFLAKNESLTIDDVAIERIRKSIAEGDAERAISMIQECQRKERPVSAPTRPTPVSELPVVSPSMGVQSTASGTETKSASPLKGFVPRDRITAGDPLLPSNAEAMVELLRDRCFQEIRRGSIAGAIDNGLDILSLARLHGDSASVVYELGLTILASLPVATWKDPVKGHELAEVLQKSLACLDSSTLTNYLANFILEPNFGEAIAERFVHAEMASCSDLLAVPLYGCVSANRPYLLEDVARAIGSAVVYGDPSVCKQLLISLARAAGETIEAVAYVQKWLENERLSSTLSERNRVSDWLAEGIKAYHAALTEKNKILSRGVPRGPALRLQVPISVGRSGGFGFTAGSDTVEFALLLSNPQNRPLSSVEISFPAVRNPWLSEDIFYSTGPISGNSRLLIQVKARLKQELTENTTLEGGWAGRYREPGKHETKFEDSRIELNFAKARELNIENYEGARGKPLILEGDALKYSSNSVRRALTEVTSGLLGNGIAALIIGRRRRGKTSILQTIAQLKEVRSQYTIISDAWEDIPSRILSTTLRHLGMVFDRAARTLNIEIDSLEHRLSIEIAPGWSVFQGWLEDLSAKLESSTKLLLLLDEFQKWITLLDSEGIVRLLSILRGLFNRPANSKLSISIVLSGLTNIRDLTRVSVDFENAFQIFPIEAFTLQETDALIRSNPSIEFDSRAIVQIRDLAGGNPFLINLLCNDLASRLREVRRAYCLPEDVEGVVNAQLEDRDNSRVWNFLQYLLKEGEEDHASEIVELPALFALAYTRKMRGSGRSFIGTDEIAYELFAAEVKCDHEILKKHLESSATNELLVKKGQRFAFSNGWLAEWLSLTEKLLPVLPRTDKDLVLGRYHLVELIDKGGQAKVYEAQDTRSSNRPVIVKIYPRIQASGISSVVMREANLLHSIEHTAVVECIESGTDEEKGDVIVLERVKGEELRDLLLKRPKHSQDLIGMEGDLKVQVKFIEQISAALAECHRLGVVHKDLKPENIMVQSSAGLWLPKIIDFGLATNITELGSDLKTSGSYTPGYVAPERYRGEGRRPPADVYSLGVVAYELLSGASPFPLDPLKAREAQESGTFVPLKGVRPEIPLRLSELIGEMLSPDPIKRPNIFTLLGRLTPSLETCDWSSDFESAKKAILDGDYETVFNYSERAVFGAPQTALKSKEYMDALEYLVSAADESRQLLAVADKLIQPVVAAAAFNDQASKTFGLLIEKLLTESAVDPSQREKQGSAIHTLVELLIDVVPNIGFQKGVELLLKNYNHPRVWREKEEIYLLGLLYKDSELIHLALVGRWCLAVSKRLRERDANLLAAQIWLRRAERIGFESSSEYVAERESLAKLLRETASPPVLPAVAKQESASIAVGDDERSHLSVSRIEKWVERLLRLHPYVQAVRRVRRDRNIPLSPTRLLPLENIAQHLQPTGDKIDSARIIPAALDDSFCNPKGTTALRINIILPSGTTIGQREAAIASLKEDSSLFGS